MTVLLPAHDGLADHVAESLPEAQVLVYDDQPVDVDAVTYYCLPYLADGAARDLIGRLPALRVVQSLSSGVDELVDLVPSDVVLCNGRGLHHEESTAELAVTLMLAALRRLPAFVRAGQRGEWRHERGESLDGRRVLLVGYGAIGAAIDARLAPFGPQVTRVSRRERGGVAPLDRLAALAADADVVVVCLPLTPETEGLVGADVFAALPNGALVVNVGRGRVVDNDALRAHLVSGRLRAALDVTDPEPLPADAVEWTLPNVLVTPHAGGDTTAFIARARSFLVEQVGRHLAGEALANVVDRGEGAGPQPATRG